MDGWIHQEGPEPWRAGPNRGLGSCVRFLSDNAPLLHDDRSIFLFVRKSIRALGGIYKQ